MSEFAPVDNAASAPAAPVAATPATPAQPATPASAAVPATTSTPTPEDRSTWVPPYRLREVNDALKQARTEAAQAVQYRAEAERYRTQLHSLVGVTPPGDPEVEAVRGQFSQVYPGLSKLEAAADEILALREQAQYFRQQNDHYWESYGRQNMDKLYDKASSSLGSPLSEEGKRHLHASFIGYLQSSPEVASRYENDPTIVDDFWKAFTSSFIDPARRVAAATTAGRVPGALPQDTPSAVPGPAGPPKLTSLDERVKAAWTQYNSKV